MVPVRSHRRCRSSLATAFAISFLARSASAGEVGITPSHTGRFGAWLAIGPLLVNNKPKAAARSIDSTVLSSGDEAQVVGRLGRSLPVLAGADDESAESADGKPSTWRLAMATDGPLDVAAALHHKEGEAFALLSGVLHLAEPLRGALLLGASDGVRVIVDHKVLLSNDAIRPERDGEEIVRLDLGAGDHPILIKLHHRTGYWAAGVRIVDQNLAAPRGAYLLLPGTTDADAKTLSGRLTSVKVDRGLGADGYEPRVTVSFPGGMPRGTDRTVRASATVHKSSGPVTLYRIDAGEVPLDDAGPSDYQVRLPRIAVDDLAGAETSGELVIAVEVAGKKVEAGIKIRKFMREAMAAAERGMESCDGPRSFLREPDVTRATIEHLRDHLAGYVNAGDSDLESLAQTAEVLKEYAADLENARDPLRSHAGIRRFAYRSPIDGQLSPFGMYVPPSYAPGATKTYPLIVVLHGMNGKPLSVVRWFFGEDDPTHDSEWEDRHPGDVPPIEAFVIGPNGFGNAMYRELGEVDVMTLVDWAERFYPIDHNRVTITGPSMGGIGAAAIALHYPDRFAASEPLCGYHSYFIRGDLAGRPLRPWERLLSEQRSNVLWAENGLYLPMYIWHGKRDWPEKNSGVLIDRYRELGYSMEDEHPNVGHDVWKKAYDGLGGYNWLARHVREEHKRRIVFKTDSTRYADDAWVHVRELASALEFGEIRASIRDDNRIEATTRGIAALSLDRDPKLLSGASPVELQIDGQKLSFAPEAPIEVEKRSGAWAAGITAPGPNIKRAGLSGPIRDVFHEPLVFVYGTDDKARTRANLEVATAWAKIRWGVDAKYLVIPDSELDEATSDSHSLVLVGAADSNRVVRELEADLPFRIEGRTVVAKDPKKEWRGTDLGVIFVYPNPRHPSRYVLVIEGVDALGTLRAIALPDLMPDWMVFDRDVASARGSLILGNAKPLAAGLFQRDWSLKL
jgi:poly(3-hydroxybutyrate) depolymerase